MIVVPRHYLVGPKDRMYVFAPLSEGRVRVDRFEGERLVETRVVARPVGRRLWVWLTTKKSYAPVKPAGRPVDLVRVLEKVGAGK